MSTINPTNINGNFPIPGRDNDSQGFRDNFSNTKTNFERAKEEIEQLEQRAILKSPLPGTELDNNLNGQVLRNLQLLQSSHTVVTDIPRDGTVTLDFNTGSFFVVGVSNDGTVDDIAIEITGDFPIGATAFRLRVYVSDAAHNMALPTNVAVEPGALPGFADGVVYFAAPGMYDFEFVTLNRGGSFTVRDLTRARTNWSLLQYQQLLDPVTAAITLDHSLTSVSCATDAAATLGDGYDGQVKFIACPALSGGVFEVSVESAAWTGAAGTITFDTVGQGCTLVFVDGLWTCVGNNGATFA